MLNAFHLPATGQWIIVGTILGDYTDTLEPDAKGKNVRYKAVTAGQIS